MKLNPKQAKVLRHFAHAVAASVVSTALAFIVSPDFTNLLPTPEAAAIVPILSPFLVGLAEHYHLTQQENTVAAGDGGQ